MKFITIAILSMTISGCATFAPYSNEERCALNGMVLEGVTEGETAESGYAYVPGTGVIPTSSSKSSESVHCRVPKSETDKCLVGAASPGAMRKANWNAGEKGRAWARGLLYLLIIPGAVVNSSQDSERKEVMAKANESYSSGRAECDRGLAGH